MDEIKHREQVDLIREVFYYQSRFDGKTIVLKIDYPILNAPHFPQLLKDLAMLRATGIEILQINVGRKCNQTCRHCHVDAGPDRTEMMPDAVVDRVIEIIESTSIPTVDITGGAPELHRRWKEIVVRARAAGKHVMDRCNLTITRLPNYAYRPAFFAEQGVHVVASLPHYREKGTDTQRGAGVFEESPQSHRRSASPNDGFAAFAASRQ